MTALRSVRSTIRKSRLLKWLAAPVSSSYGRWWDLEGLSSGGARRSMGAGDLTDAEFDESGRVQAAELSEFVAADGRVLDLGCGMGRVLKHIAPYCREAVGLDVSNRMLSLARKHVAGIGNVSLTRGNGAELLMFEDNSFDFCYAIQMFHQIEREDTIRYLVEIERVLKPGGSLYLDFLDLESEQNAKEFKEYALESQVRRISRRRFFTEQELRAFARLARLDDCEIVRSGRYLVLQRSNSPKSGDAEGSA